MPRTRRNRSSRSLANRRDQAIVMQALRPVSNVSTTVTRVLTYESNYSSSVAGVIAAQVPFNPTGYSDWTAMAALYDEFRVIGGTIKFFCAQQNSVTVQAAPIICVYDNDDQSTALTGYTGALDYSSKIQFSSIWDNNRFPSMTAACYSAASPTTGVVWATTGNPAAFIHSFKMFGNGLTASTTYLNVTAQIVVQFRGPT